MQTQNLNGGWSFHYFANQENFVLKFSSFTKVFAFLYWDYKKVTSKYFCKVRTPLSWYNLRKESRFFSLFFQKQFLADLVLFSLKVLALMRALRFRQGCWLDSSSTNWSMRICLGCLLYILNVYASPLLCTFFLSTSIGICYEMCNRIITKKDSYIVFLPLEFLFGNQ